MGDRAVVRQNLREQALGKFARIFAFYRDGFKSMVVGRLLWKVILVKLIVLYALAKIFFPNFLQTKFRTDQDRAEHVLAELTAPRSGR